MFTRGRGGAECPPIQTINVHCQLEKCAVVSTCRPTPDECKFWLHLLSSDKNTEQVQKCPVVWTIGHAHSRCCASRPIPITKVKTVIRGLGLGYDLRVIACRGPAMGYLSTDFGGDSSSRFPSRARTNRLTEATEFPIPRRRSAAAIQPSYLLLHCCVTVTFRWVCSFWKCSWCLCFFIFVFFYQGQLLVHAVPCCAATVYAVLLWLYLLSAFRKLNTYIKNYPKHGKKRSNTV